LEDIPTHPNVFVIVSTYIHFSGINLVFVKNGQGHVEGYHELSAKTKLYFATVVTIWDADFYIKVDDDVHVNLGK
jgi:hypothetical protein